MTLFTSAVPLVLYLGVDLFARPGLTRSESRSNPNRRSLCVRSRPARYEWGLQAMRSEADKAALVAAHAASSAADRWLKVAKDQVMT